ncbi:hypothetical protein F5877DRAFT_54581, partial [Lentinula edodes]
NYYFHSEWLNTIWLNYTLAVTFIEGKVDSSGLPNVNGLRDWVLIIATYILCPPHHSFPHLFCERLCLQPTFNSAFWMLKVGMYRDNTSKTLTPQDGNSLAVLFNVALNDTWKELINEGLEKNWVELGPVPPESPDTISPFIGEFEVT